MATSKNVLRKRLKRSLKGMWASTARMQTTLGKEASTSHPKNSLPTPRIQWPFFQEDTGSPSFNIWVGTNQTTQLFAPEPGAMESPASKSFLAAVESNPRNGPLCRDSIAMSIHSPQAAMRTPWSVEAMIAHPRRQPECLGPESRDSEGIAP